MKVKKIPLSQVDITPEEEHEIVSNFQQRIESEQRQKRLVCIGKEFADKIEHFSFEDKKKIMESVVKYLNKQSEDAIEESKEDIKLIGKFIESKIKEKF